MGAPVGKAVALTDGAAVGLAVGTTVGATVGMAVAPTDGAAVGFVVGTAVGATVGTVVTGSVEVPCTAAVAPSANDNDIFIALITNLAGVTPMASCCSSSRA